MTHPPSDPATDPRPDPDEPSRVAARRRRRRRALTWCLAALATLSVARIAAPTILAPLITSRLRAALGVPVSIEGVELGLWAGEITVRGVEAAPGADASGSTLQIAAATLRWDWAELRRRTLVVDVDLSGVDVTLDARRPWPAVDGAERRGPRALPPSLRSVHVVDGAVAVVLTADTPPILELTDLQVSLDETSMGFRTEATTTRLKLRAQTPDGGHLTIDGMVAPVAPAATWSLRFVLDRLDLRRQNPLFQELLEMDVEQGWLSLDGELTVGQGRLRGRVRPRFDELRLLGRGEQKVRHPMVEALFGSMLSGADLPIAFDRSMTDAGDTMLSQISHTDAMALLNQVILGGLIRRLDTLEGLKSSVARLEVDFPAGRLSFFDVTLNRSSGLVDRPFVHIERMDIVVEQTAVDADVLTYKEITLHAPSLTFVAGLTEARSQLSLDPNWQAKVNVLPYPTDKLTILDGRVEYRDVTIDPPTSVFVSDLDLRAGNIGRALVGGKRRGATLEGRARAMGLSQLTLDAMYTPGTIDLDASMRLHLEPLALDQLNDLLRASLKVDVSRGTLGLTADMDVLEGHMRGTVTPELRRIQVLGSQEQEIAHPVRELILERRLQRLDGVPLKLDYHVRNNLLRELPGALLSAAMRAG
jgi:hypothetical protein